MNVKVGAFNQEKAWVGAFSMIVKSFVWSSSTDALLPYTTFEESSILFTLLCKTTFLLLLTILVTGCNIISLGSVASVMAELHPAGQKLLRVGQKHPGSVGHLNTKIVHILIFENVNINLIINFNPILFTLFILKTTLSSPSFFTIVHVASLDMIQASSIQKIIHLIWELSPSEL